MGEIGFKFTIFCRNYYCVKFKMFQFFAKYTVDIFMSTLLHNQIDSVCNEQRASIRWSFGCVRIDWLLESLAAWLVTPFRTQPLANVLRSLRESCDRPSRQNSRRAIADAVQARDRAGHDAVNDGPC